MGRQGASYPWGHARPHSFLRTRRPRPIWRHAKAMISHWFWNMSGTDLPTGLGRTPMRGASHGMLSDLSVPVRPARSDDGFG